MSVDWNNRYQAGETPWEKGEPHPELPFLLARHQELFSSAKGILVPGCGLGHDAALIFGVTGGNIVGLDLASEAISRATQRYPDLAITWETGDLFERQGQFDLVFEHTCFCAIPPGRRPDYAATMARLIPPGGHLMGIFFLNPDHEGEEGPPFGVTPEELQGFFGKDFALVWSEKLAKTFEGREGDGRELSMIWKRHA